MPQAAMRSDLVIVEPPVFDLLGCVCQAQEPVLVQALLPDKAIERLDKRIAGRLSGPAEVERHLIEVRSPVERLRDELGTVVYADRLRNVPPIARLSQVKLSTSVSKRNQCPSKSCSDMKSMLQLS